VKSSIVWLFGHNFSTRNARKPIKGSKDLDYSPVSKKMSWKVPSCSWCQGPWPKWPKT